MIGVVLIVGMTVVLAAIIATYALGFTVGESIPTATFSSEYDENDDVLTVTHQSGDPIPADSLQVRGDLGSCSLVVCTGQDTLSETGGYGSGSTFRGGQQFLVKTADDDFRVTLVYDDGEASARLRVFTGPEA